MICTKVLNRSLSNAILYVKILKAELKSFFFHRKINKFEVNVNLAVCKLLFDNDLFYNKCLVLVSSHKKFCMKKKMVIIFSRIFLIFLPENVNVKKPFK